ncbi:hypothetical protein EDB86DRAFT_3073293 [Lactarius hatsudake]|nr:hypothetical protein EDB86DRAFT_3073293 [Lactarius hatsudake]
MSTTTTGDTERDTPSMVTSGAVFGFCPAKFRKFQTKTQVILQRILLSTSLFSATVSLFVVESYERLSPDPGDQTVFLLNKLSQQLAGISKGALVDSLPPSDPKSIFYPRLSYVSIL